MIRSTRLFPVLLLALAGFLSLPAWGDDIAVKDWPVFRGNALQTGVAASPLPNKLDVVWQFKTADSVENAAAVVNGVVYVGSFDGHLYALDLATGKEKWKYKAGPFKGPPSVRGGAVYVGDADGIFHCVDAATGTKRWTFETEGEITSGAGFTGEAVLFGSGDEQLYCLSLEGKPRWKFKVPGGPVMATPTVVNGRTFVAGCDSALHVIDTANGKEVASVDLGGQAGATAAVKGGNLYLGTMGNEVLAIDWNKAEVVWRYSAARRQQAFYSSAAVTDDLVIVGGRDRRVHALNRKTGKEVWGFDTDNRVDSSPVVVDSRVFVGSFDGHLYVLDRAKGTLLHKFKLDGPVAASPAVAGNRLIVGTLKGTVYCFGAKD